MTSQQFGSDADAIIESSFNCQINSATLSMLECSISGTIEIFQRFDNCLMYTSSEKFNGLIFRRHPMHSTSMCVFWNGTWKWEPSTRQHNNTIRRWKNPINQKINTNWERKTAANDEKWRNNFAISCGRLFVNAHSVPTIGRREASKLKMHSLLFPAFGLLSFRVAFLWWHMVLLGVYSAVAQRYRWSVSAFRVAMPPLLT